MIFPTMDLADEATLDNELKKRLLPFNLFPASLWEMNPVLSDVEAKTTDSTSTSCCEETDTEELSWYTA